MRFVSVDQLGMEYNLLWPPEIFKEEIEAILQRRNDAPGPRGYRLLSEAFEDEAVAREYIGALPMWELDGQPISQREYLDFLAKNAEELHNRSVGSPYWLERSGIPAPGLEPMQTTLREEFIALIDELIDLGYFYKRAPTPCSSTYGEDQPSTDEQLNQIVSRNLQTPDVWVRVRNSEMGDDYTYAAMEVLHDVVSRPIRWWDDPQNDCGFHYEEFSAPIGQQVYRWKANELLKRHDRGLKLADTGENVGRLIRTFSQPLEELRISAIPQTDEPSQGTIEHAISMFERRGASREHKRSACVSLAGILEQRRGLIKQSLNSADENMLFEMANKFDLRHRNSRQNSNYGEEFLDWIFWIYLATVQLTNTAIETQERIQPGRQD